MGAVVLAKFPSLLQDLNRMLSAVAPSGRARPTAQKTRLRSVGSIPEHMLPQAAIPDASTRDLLSTLRGK